MSENGQAIDLLHSALDALSSKGYVELVQSRLEENLETLRRRLEAGCTVREEDVLRGQIKETKRFLSVRAKLVEELSEMRKEPQ